MKAVPVGEFVPCSKTFSSLLAMHNFHSNTFLCVITL